MKFLGYRIFSHFCFNCVKSIWNKEQSVSRSSYLISKYGSLISFFGSFEMSVIKEISDAVCRFQELCWFFLYFSIFTINSYCCRLYDASEIFSIPSRIFYSCLIWLRFFFLLFSLFFRNSGQLAGIHPGCRKHMEIQSAKFPFAFLKTFFWP